MPSPRTLAPRTSNTIIMITALWSAMNCLIELSSRSARDERTRRTGCSGRSSGSGEGEDRCSSSCSRAAMRLRWSSAAASWVASCCACAACCRLSRRSRSSAARTSNEPLLPRRPEPLHPATCYAHSSLGPADTGLSITDPARVPRLNVMAAAGRGVAASDDPLGGAGVASLSRCRVASRRARRSAAGRFRAVDMARCGSDTAGARPLHRKGSGRAT